MITFANPKILWLLLILLPIAVWYVLNNKKRKMYHNHYCKGKWGDSRNYDLCINSSILGVDGTVKLITQYIQDFEDRKS